MCVSQQGLYSVEMVLPPPPNVTFLISLAPWKEQRPRGRRLPFKKVKEGFGGNKSGWKRRLKRRVQMQQDEIWADEGMRAVSRVAHL